ncbi:MAG: prephenate dehydrogenase/arogenate dehydrogenase family protein [Dehalococcoidia bacterium]|nr:prephenate dehydrogenase/arogenate dehydrogenase family protein [Dehalococcoidia bacterium]
MSKKVAIIGTGLIGTSIGMALKKSLGDKLELVGHDRDPERSRQAVQMGAFHKSEVNLLRTIEDADVVILAVPLGAMPSIMKDAYDSFSTNCVVTDTGSTKAQVVKWAEELLPKHVAFVAAHPMAGREISGPEGAKVDLFAGATYCICPTVTTKRDALDVVVGLVESVGAKPLFIDAYEHDSYVSFVSHLPIIIASALISSTNKSEGWREISRLASSGYKDTSRLASGDPVMNTDVCMLNKEHISARIDDYITELKNWKTLINGDGVELEKQFTRVWEARERVISGADMTQETRPFEKIPSATDYLMGTVATRKLNEALDKWTEAKAAKNKKRS